MNMFFRALIVLAALLPLPVMAEGVVIRLGEAPMPPSVTAMSVVDLTVELGMAPISSSPIDAAPALAAFAQGESLFWKSGRLKAAIKALEGARGQLPKRVSAGNRATVNRGLWLLAQLHQHDGNKDQAIQVIDETLQIDASIAPDPARTPPSLIELFKERKVIFVKTARNLDVETSDRRTDCTVLIDGAEEGALGARFELLAPSSYQVAVRCGDQSSWAHTVDLSVANQKVQINPWEFGLEIADQALVIPDKSTLRSLQHYLVSHSSAQWILLVAAADGDFVHVRITSRDQIRTETEASVPLVGVKAWVDKQIAEGLLSGQVKGGGKIKWYHWALAGSGAALLVWGGVEHGNAQELYDKTNSGDEDLRDEMASSETTYGTLYVMGSALLTTGIVLAVMASMSEDQSTAIVPGPGMIHLVHRF